MSLSSSFPENLRKIVCAFAAALCLFTAARAQSQQEPDETVTVNTNLVILNVGVAQLLWFKSIRTGLLPLFVVSLLINLGMWIERFVIVVGSLARDFLPATWGVFTPTMWDWSMLFGTLGLFTALMFLFVRLLPIIPAFEMRRLLRFVIQ